MSDICTIYEQIFATVESNKLDVRFFEVITMIGFIYFEQQKCDYVMLECGLGGGLDATNVMDPQDVVCSTIVSIGFDHMDVLGNTLEEIAEEKAGIIKANGTCVIGPSCKDLKVITDIALKQDAKLIQIENG